MFKNSFYQTYVKGVILMYIFSKNCLGDIKNTRNEIKIKEKKR